MKTIMLTCSKDRFSFLPPVLCCFSCKKVYSLHHMYVQHNCTVNGVYLQSVSGPQSGHFPIMETWLSRLIILN